MTRREWAGAAVAVMGTPASAGQTSSSSGSITDVAGVKVGHFTDKRRPTGCSVVLFEKGAVAGVDVRGSAPGTRETDLLNPVNTVQQIHAIALCGGSAYGLDAASGVMRYLEEKGIGFKVGPNIVPIVPAAVLFDLGVGDGKIRPTAESGYLACEAAQAGHVEEGNVGAGAGATIGKVFGAQWAMKSGIGTAAIHVSRTGLIVGALVAVNAVGDVRDPATGKIVAGARTEHGFRDTMAQIREGYGVEVLGANTTIGVIATNASFNKEQITKVAQMAHDGLARTINPVHSPSDGDTLFAAATGSLNTTISHGAVGALAAEMVAMAVLRAVKTARSLPNLPSARDWPPA